LPAPGWDFSIVKGYTDLLGGRITVRDQLPRDRGSTFTV
jgi:signal transduction histidine kinase